MKNLKVGDTVYIVPHEHSGRDPYDATITKVGRKYIHVSTITDGHVPAELFDRQSGDSRPDTWPSATLWVSRNAYVLHLLCVKMRKDLMERIPLLSDEEIAALHKHMLGHNYEGNLK